MKLPKRKLNRLKGYDYSSPGAYFVTICTHKRKNLFGDIVWGDILNVPKMVFSPVGKIVNDEILNIASHYSNINIEKYVVMPNHVHLIIRITERINPFPTIKYDIPNVVGKFKAAVTRNVGKAFMPSEKIRIWQSSFNDHIFRGVQDYKEIWDYIHNNPVKWKEDGFYTE